MKKGMEEPALGEFGPRCRSGDVAWRKTNVQVRQRHEYSLFDVQGDKNYDEAECLNGSGSIGSKERRQAGAQSRGVESCDQHDSYGVFKMGRGAEFVLCLLEK